MKTERVTLYFREGSSDKVYQAALEEKDGGYVVNFAYGRRGSTLQTGAKTAAPVAYEKAKDIYDKLVRSKTSKGYTPGEDGTPYQGTDKETRDSGVRCQLLNPIAEAALDGCLDDENYWLQEKKDGRRMLLQKNGKDVLGLNRSGLAVGLPGSLAKDALRLNGAFLIDGEAVGETVFAFDLLQREGQDLRGQPYALRLRALGKLLAAAGLKRVALVETAMSAPNKRLHFERLKREKREGVVLKHCAAPYTPGRPASGGTQLKHKFYATASCLVARHNDKRSVALELIDGKKRVAAGNVTIPPNAAIPAEGAIVEVRYLYAYQESGCLYQPVFLAVRDDIPAKNCTAAQLKYRQPSEDDEA